MIYLLKKYQQMDFILWVLVYTWRGSVIKKGQGYLPAWHSTISYMIVYLGAYIKLQNVYHVKAKKDASAVNNPIDKIMQSIGHFRERMKITLQHFFISSSYKMLILN